MLSRRVLATLAVLACALAGAMMLAPSTPAKLKHAAVLKNQLMREHVLLLKGYVEAYATAHDGQYPLPTDVSQGGGLPAPVWPRNPWTGRSLEAGVDCGDYEYSVALDRLGFTLTGHLSSGLTSVVYGASEAPGVALDRDALVGEGVEIIKQAAQLYEFLHNDTAPADASPATLGAYVDQWPMNPYTGAAMATSSTAAGDCSYSGDYASFTLAGYGAGGVQVCSADSTWYDANLGGLRERLKDECAKANGRVLQSYIEEWALAHGGALPSAAEFTSGGAVGAAHDQWPLDPWTSAAMQPGTSHGSYAYTPGTGGGYTLRTYLTPVSPFSAYVDYAGTAVGAAPSAAVADAAVKTGACLIERFLKDFATASGALPSAADLQPTGSIGITQPTWPLSPYDGLAMRPGTAPGQFSYVPDADGSYTLTAHLGSGTYTLNGTAHDWAMQKDQLAIQGATFISYGIELYSLANNGLYPAPATPLSDSLAPYIDPWPKNPWMNTAMTGSTFRGNYVYSLGPDSYSLKVNLCNGSTYDVAALWTHGTWAPLHRMPISLKDLCAQSGLQVIKADLEMWKLTHDGVAPSADELRVLVQTPANPWWPVNPWMGTYMSSGSSYGQYTYAKTGPGVGDYTLSLHQVPLPMVNGDPATEFPAIYVAQ